MQSKKVQFTKTSKQRRYHWERDIHVYPMAFYKKIITDNNTNAAGYNKFTVGILHRRKSDEGTLQFHCVMGL